MKVPTIDLHGIAHYEAEHNVIRFIEKHLFTDNEIKIVTGNSTRMRDIIVNILNEYSLDYTIGKSCDAFNKGYLAVKLDYKEE